MESVSQPGGQDVGLRIVVVRPRCQDMPGAPGFDFDWRGGRIGRDPDCELALADAERHVSRLQARIEHDGRSFVLLDCGSNPTRVDGRALGRGMRVALHGGESLLIGPYELSVERLVAPALPLPGSRSPLADDPLGLFGAGPATHGDLARLCAPPGASPAQAFLSDDDPFAVFASAAVAGDGAGQQPGLAEILEGGFAGGPGCLDPLVAFGMAGVVASRDVQAPQRDDAPLLAQAFAAPRSPDAGRADLDMGAWPPVFQPGASSSVAPASDARAGAGIAALLQAFERGLGVPILLGREPTPERMEQAGATLRAALQAVLEQFRVSLCERLTRQQAESARQAGREFEQQFDRELLWAYQQQALCPRHERAEDG